MRNLFSYRSLSLAFLMLLPIEAGAATVNGFQIRLEGLLSAPLGSYESIDAKASDVFAPGLGFVVTPTFGWTSTINAGVRVGYWSSGKGGTVQFDRPIEVPGLPAPESYQIRRRIGMVPIHALVEYRRPFGDLGLEFAAGAGLNSAIEKVTLASTVHLFEISGYQKSFSALLGAGVAYPLGDFDLTGGLSFEQLFTDDGDIWAKGDNPSFFSVTAGFRYPR
jgi:hypothetical protein